MGAVKKVAAPAPKARAKPKPKAKVARRRKPAPAPAARRVAMTPSERQKVWLATILLSMLIGLMMAVSGEVRHTDHGLRAGFRNLRGEVHWWVELQPGRWPRLVRRS